MESAITPPETKISKTSKAPASKKKKQSSKSPHTKKSTPSPQRSTLKEIHHHHKEVQVHTKKSTPSPAPKCKNITTPSPKPHNSKSKINTQQVFYDQYVAMWKEVNQTDKMPKAKHTEFWERARADSLPDKKRRTPTGGSKENPISSSGKKKKSAYA
jgi:hypothetical protein